MGNSSNKETFTKVDVETKVETKITKVITVSSKYNSIQERIYRSVPVRQTTTSDTVGYIIDDDTELLYWERESNNTIIGTFLNKNTQNKFTVKTCSSGFYTVMDPAKKLKDETSKEICVN